MRVFSCYGCIDPFLSVCLSVFNSWLFHNNYSLYNNFLCLVFFVRSKAGHIVIIIIIIIIFLSLCNTTFYFLTVMSFFHVKIKLEKVVLLQEKYPCTSSFCIIIAFCVLKSRLSETCIDFSSKLVCKFSE